jgi:hypothetical protein
MTKLIASTPFLNVSIKVRPGSTQGSYKVETAPKKICVTQSDSVINYQIVDTGEYEISFNKKNPMTVLPAINDQLSLPSVSVSGKILTLNDANSSKMNLAITLNFVDEAGVEFSHDPEVENDPEGVTSTL